MYQQGDIIVVPFPFTDLTTAKQRPAIIISNPEKMIYTGDVIVVMITTKIKSDGINIPILEQSADIVLPQNSFVRCHRIATIDEIIIQKKIGTITSGFLNSILLAIDSILKIKK